MAPAPPAATYDYHQEINDRNGHIMDAQEELDTADKRDSYGAGAAKSSYVPSSRPPYKSHNSGAGPSFQPARPPPPPPTRSMSGTVPIQTSGFATSGPLSPGSTPSTPSRQLPPGAGLLSSPAWNPDDPAKRGVSSSMRDMNDSLPGSRGYVSSSANSSRSSLVMNGPASDVRNAPSQFSASQQQHHGHHHASSPSTSQSYSLLTDPATSAAAGLAADVPSPSSTVATGTGRNGPQRPSSGGQQYGYSSQQLSSGSHLNERPTPSLTTVDSPAGSTKGDREGKSKGEKSSKSKGGLGSFLGERVRPILELIVMLIVDECLSPSRCLFEPK